MRIIAYSYTDPLLETAPDDSIWGWEVDQIYQDMGGRSQLQQLIYECPSPTYLLIRRLDELGDTLQQVGDRLNQLETMGVIIIAIEQPYISETAEVPLTMLDLAQEIQSQQRSRRIRSGHAKNRLEALRPPGKVPYGYRVSKGKYIIDRSTSPLVKEFIDHFLLYASVRGAVRYLAKKYGKKISVTTGRRWLTNPVYRGDTIYQNGETISNTHPGIISKEESAQVDRILRSNSRLSSRTASAPYSLAGLVLCNQCQQKMNINRVTHSSQSQEYLYLRNTKCPQNPKCHSISYEQVLTRTIETICQNLPTAVDQVNFSQLDSMKKKLTAQILSKQAIVDQLPILIETGVLDQETAKLRRYKLQTEISQLESQLAILPPVNLSSVAQAVSIPQFWMDLSEVERRFYLREFIRQIEIIRQGENWNLQIIFSF